MTPITIKDKRTNENLSVPCGRCPTCFKRRISAWSFRLMQEEKRSTSAYFITLTYDKPPITKNGFMGLSKRDCQLFIKRLRKAHENYYNSDKSRLVGEPKPIKYYLCGEYGGKTYRPHYHIILFNAKIELIQPSWNLGHIHYGSLTPASVGYTLKYMSKTKRIPLHRNDDRQPEFSLMSKRLGDNYITEKTIRFHHADLLNRMCLNIEDGKKVAMPRYYKEKIYTRSQRSEISGYQKGMIEEKTIKEIQQYPGNYARDKNQSTIAAIKKMERDSLINRNKI